MTRCMRLLPLIAALMAVGSADVPQIADAADADQKSAESDRQKSAREERDLCRKNLRKLALAMHNFHDVFRSLPPHASYDGKRPLLSWQAGRLAGGSRQAG